MEAQQKPDAGGNNWGKLLILVLFAGAIVAFFALGGQRYLAAAFTNIKVSTYVLATAIGIIPGTFVFANLGETLGTIDSLAGLVSAETLVALALLGVLALVPVAIRKLKSKRAPAA